MVIIGNMHAMNKEFQLSFFFFNLKVVNILSTSESLSPSFFFFLRARLRHMEVPRLGVKSELQPPAYPTALVMQDPTASTACTTAHGKPDP